MAIVDELSKSELFGGMEPNQLEQISVLCRGASYREGAKIFKEGDKAANLYVLTSGAVILEMDVRPMQDHPSIPTAVEVVNKSQCFGWSAVVEPYIYTLSARCTTNCTVLDIKGDMLQMAMVRDPNLGLELMKRVSRLISVRLAHTRLRLTSGLGIALSSRELKSLEQLKTI
jgi:CRP-like cAMP-binding protein